MANEELTIQPNGARMTVIGKSWPDQASDSGGGDWDDTYNGTYSGPIPRTDLPVKIAVTTSPDKNDYHNGESIDLTGIVVTAYNEDGTVWTSEDYPDGIVPIDELAPQTTKALAIDGNAPDFFYVGNNRFIVNPPYKRSEELVDYRHFDYSYDYFYYATSFGCPAVTFSDFANEYFTATSDHYDSTGGIHIFHPGENWTGDYYLLASSTGSVQASIVRATIRPSDSFPPDRYSEYGISQYNYTREGEKVYYSIWNNYDLNARRSAPHRSLIANPTINGRPYNGGRPWWANEVAWRMVYGTMSGKYNNIIISWQRPEDGEELKTFFPIWVQNSIVTIGNT